MLRWPYWIGRPFHCLETGVSAGMGTASDSDAASRVTQLRGLLYLPEALGANDDGKAPVPAYHPDPSPDHLRPARRTDKVLPELLLLAHLLTHRLHIVGKEDVGRKTVRCQEDYGCPLTAHKAVLIPFEPNTKVLISPRLYRLV